MGPEQAPEPPRAERRALATAALAVVALGSAVVLFDPRPGDAAPFPGADKVVHALTFALLAVTARWRFGAVRVVATAVVAYAMASEVVQGIWLDHRTGDVVDVAADLVGAAAGWWATARMARPDQAA